jgi:transcriptional regulator of arginine metabolism
VRPAGTLVVLKTPAAAAPPVARALDEASLPEAVGALAGDDTVFLATASERAARALARRLTAALTRRTLRKGA